MSLYPDDVNITVPVMHYMHEEIKEQCRHHGNDTVENMVNSYIIDGLMKQQEFDTFSEASGFRGWLARFLSWNLAERIQQWAERICPDPPKEDHDTKH